LNLSIDHQSHVPLHQQVEQLLRRMVKQRAYAEGKLLPPETELATRLCVSRSTLRAGIEKLVYDGLLIRKRGFGTQVAPPTTRSSRMEAWDSFTREMQSLGETVEQFSCRCTRRAAPGWVGKAFNLRAGSRVCALERVKGIRSEPVVHFMSYFHPRLGLTGGENYDRPLYEVLREVCHIEPAESHERITAVSAEAKIAKALRVLKGSPLLRRERRVTDSAGRMIECAVNHYRSDRFEYTVSLRRDA